MRQIALIHASNFDLLLSYWPPCQLGNLLILVSKFSQRRTLSFNQVIAMTSPRFDLAAAHRHFSVECFNRVWELIDKPGRSPDEERLMVSMCHASLYHWRQRADCTARNLSVGYWQLSRVYALLNEADNARQYARLCLAQSQNEPPFYLGYAHEALARAEALAGNGEEARQHLSAARDLAAQVTNTDERSLLEADLAGLTI